MAHVAGGGMRFVPTHAQAETSRESGRVYRPLTSRPNAPRMRMWPLSLARARSVDNRRRVQPYLGLSRRDVARRSPGLTLPLPPA
jgi:hypothetical protein